VVNTMCQAMKSELESEGILILSVDPGPTQSHMVAAGDGIPWIIRILRPLLFKPASSQTAKLLSGVMKAREQGATGIYISEGKVKPEHPLALDPVIQAEVMDLLKGQLERT
jgi:short-subunit dehydrogenase